MKNDFQEENLVIQELAWDPAINADLICVVVYAGHVALFGHVNSYREKIAAEKAAVRVEGVKEISSSLTVALPAMYRKDDKAIENAIREMLKWH